MIILSRRYDCRLIKPEEQLEKLAEGGWEMIHYF